MAFWFLGGVLRHPLPVIGSPVDSNFSWKLHLCAVLCNIIEYSLRDSTWSDARIRYPSHGDEARVVVEIFTLCIKYPGLGVEAPCKYLAIVARAPEVEPVDVWGIQTSHVLLLHIVLVVFAG